MLHIPLLGRFVAGTSIADATRVSSELQKKFMGAIVDYAVEDGNAVDQIETQIRTLPTHSHIAIKCSALDMQHGLEHSYQHADKLCELAMRRSQSVYIDAERVGQQPIIQEISNRLIKKYNASNPKIYKTYQMYCVDSLTNLQQDLERIPCFGIKLVRGAYHHQDITTGQLFTDIIETHTNYNRGLVHVLQHEKVQAGDVKVLFATHNEQSIHLAKTMLETHPDLKQNVSFAQLLGMSDRTSTKLVENGYTVQKYVPYGPFLKMVPYLIRRLYENLGILKYI